jgi:prepilin-type N-terminal cleavage/methylation domain-containing protein
MPPTLPCGRRPGFRLVELLVVLAVAAVLLSLLLPAVRQSRIGAARQQSMTNLHQLCVAMHDVNDVYGELPPAFGYFPGPNDGTADYASGWSDPRPAHHGSLHYFLLPYVEEDNLYKQTGGDSWGVGTPVKKYVSPADPQSVSGLGARATDRPVTTYKSNLFVFSPGDGVGKVNRDPGQAGATGIPSAFPDGTSVTIAFAECYASCGDADVLWPESNWRGPWTPAFDTTALPQFGPRPKDCDGKLLQGHGRGGVLVGMGDGGVRSVAAGVTAGTWEHAVLPNDGEALGSDW